QATDCVLSGKSHRRRSRGRNSLQRVTRLCFTDVAGIHGAGGIRQCYGDTLDSEWKSGPASAGSDDGDETAPGICGSEQSDGTKTDRNLERGVESAAAADRNPR